MLPDIIASRGTFGWTVDVYAEGWVHIERFRVGDKPAAERLMKYIMETCLANPLLNPKKETKNES